MNTHLFKQVIRDERGMETVEWAVLASLIVVGLTSVVLSLGMTIFRKFLGIQIMTGGHPN